MIVYKSPFSVDWTNLEAVIAYAKQLGPGQSVVKYVGRRNYNIIHTKNENNENSHFRKSYPPFEVIFKTGDG